MEEMLTGAGTLPRRYRGVPVPLWFDMNTSQKLQGMQLLETDVILDSWPKSGTHWIYQALRLLSRDDEAPKGDLKLVEMFPPQEMFPAQNRDVVPDVSTGPGRIIEQLASADEMDAKLKLFGNKHYSNGVGPLYIQKDSLDALLEREAAGDFRLLVTHAPVSWLPIKAGQPGAKLVYVTRDPRDVVVSNYFFLGTPKDGWDGSMNRFLASAERTPNAFGAWFEHVAEFEALVAALGPDRALLIEYEDMHLDMPGQLQRLAKFLGPSAEARLELIRMRFQKAKSQQIYAALGFSSMQTDKGMKSFLRKGQMGAWREHFSPEDEARMAKALAERLPAAHSLIGRSSWRTEPQ